MLRNGEPSLPTGRTGRVCISAAASQSAGEPRARRRDRRGLGGVGAGIQSDTLPNLSLQRTAGSRSAAERGVSQVEIGGGAG